MSSQTTQNFTYILLLFCKRRQQNVQRILTQMHSHCNDSEISVSPGDQRKLPASRPGRTGYLDPNKKSK